MCVVDTCEGVDVGDEERTRPAVAFGDGAQLSSIRCSGVITARLAERVTTVPGHTTHASIEAPSTIFTSLPTTEFRIAER